MRNKGFTLIELLAVIVILAIIALIATPIILGIIKDSKKESDKRSIEMYADTLKNAIAQYQLDGKELEVRKLNVKEGTQGKEFEGTKIKVEYDGNVVCDVIEVYADGNVYLDKCKVNGEEVKYSYGKKASFAEDSWETIAKNVKLGYMYEVGETKEVSLKPPFINQEENSNGLYTVRIANVSNPAECSTEGFSQTSCGFVVEFVDIITTRNMSNTGVDGYPVSEMYPYIRNDIYNSLPEDLKSVIKDTKVVSSHGSTSGETNFVSTDKLYLLSTKEVWGSNPESCGHPSTGILGCDTSADQTRQLDYYKNYENLDGSLGVTTSLYSGAIKKYNGSAASWWLRSIISDSGAYFYRVCNDGDWSDLAAREPDGVAVAFRIG